MFGNAGRLSVLGCAVLSLSGGVSADHHFDARRNDSIGVADKQLAAELTAFLAAYETAYDNQDYDAVQRMWFDDGNPVYMAEEVPFPLYGKERMNRYFNPVPGRLVLDGIDNSYSEVRAKYLSPDIALATYRLDYDIKLVGMPAVHGWDRVMAVFVRTKGGWKLTAYAEAPMGPMTMVRRMMKADPAGGEQRESDYATTRRTIQSLAERAVSPGFAAFLEERAALRE
ncbi:MAG: nuclear transport factor 2 family protein [Gammaproteobacteria bacterium]